MSNFDRDTLFLYSYICFRLNSSEGRVQCNLYLGNSEGISSEIFFTSECLGTLDLIYQIRKLKSKNNTSEKINVLRTLFVLKFFKTFLNVF